MILDTVYLYFMLEMLSLVMVAGEVGLLGMTEQ